MKVFNVKLTTFNMDWSNELNGLRQKEVIQTSTGLEDDWLTAKLATNTLTQSSTGLTEQRS